MAMRRTSGDPRKAVEGLIEEVRAKETQALAGASLVLVGVIKETLSTPGRGAIRAGGRERVGAGSFNRDKEGNLRMVRRGAPRTNIDPTNRASAPGDPPAPDMGNLRNSIDYEMVDATTARVGTNVEYAEPLEFGTTNAGRNHNVVIEPRPFMRPSIAAARPTMSRFIAGRLHFGGEGGE